MFREERDTDPRAALPADDRMRCRYRLSEISTTRGINLMTASNSKEGFSIGPRRWCGWQEAPPQNPGWGAGPVFVTNVTALKTGKGLLHVEFIQAMHPRGAKCRSLDLKVLYRAAAHLVGTFVGADGKLRTVLVSAMSYDWLRSDVPLLYERRPPQGSGWLISGVAAPGPEIDEYLSIALGRTEDEILHGTTSTSFRANSDEKPAQVSRFVIDQTYSSFASWLISRGFTPRSMDDKWFIYLEAGMLVFRRSWTGFVIYEVEAQWRGDDLYLGQVKVNRDKRQYEETDDEYDKKLLAYLIDAILIGVPATFPFKDH